tara:strand:- start:30131 stop:31813 length:1683 start_codon:yes stop_codon:yes gene_type:complete
MYSDDVILDTNFSQQNTDTWMIADCFYCDSLGVETVVGRDLLEVSPQQNILQPDLLTELGLSSLITGKALIKQVYDVLDFQGVLGEELSPIKDGQLKEILPLNDIETHYNRVLEPFDDLLNISSYEYGAFGLGGKDKELAHVDNYALMEINRNETSLIVGSIHFPSSQPVAFQLKNLTPLLDDIYGRIEINDDFVVIGDINCLTVVGQNSTEQQKAEVESNISEIVSYLQSYGHKKGIEFHVDFPQSSIAKERVSDDLTKNPQELIKSGLVVRDTMIAITAKYIGFDNPAENTKWVSYTSAEYGQTNEVIDFALLGAQPFDHIIMSTEVNGLKIYYVNVIESAGSKGFKESQYQQLPEASLSQKWTRDVYEALAIVLSPDLSVEELHSWDNVTLKEFLNASRIEFNTGNQVDKENIVQILAQEFISEVKLLSSTTELMSLLKEGISINWDKITSEIVRSCVGKNGAISSFTTKLAASHFSQEVFGGFVLSEQYHKLYGELGAEGVRDVVEQHQLEILTALQQRENGLVLLCENNKENLAFTDIAKSLVLPNLSQEQRIFH